MFKNFFKKEKVRNEDINNQNILITALLIHAAKIDENYTNAEKQIIKKAMINLGKTTPASVDDLLMKAEKKSKNRIKFSNLLKKLKKTRWNLDLI